MQPAQVRVRIKGTGLYIEQHRPRASVSAEPAYRAAGTGARLLYWNKGNAGPNSAFVGALETLRGRSRDVVRKSPFAAGAIDSLVGNIIGTGIKPQFVTADREFNKALAALWLDWVDQADSEGMHDFYGLQALAVRSAGEGGECFVRLRARKPEDRLAVPLQLQLLEGEFCPADKTEMATSGNAITNGVEYDKLGRRVAYWLYREHPREWTGVWRTNNTETVRVPAAGVVHFYEILRPGQTRGLPWLTPALVKLYDLDLYDDAEMRRKQLAAFLAGFITSDVPDSEDGLLNEGEADSAGAAIATMENGTMLNLAPGEDVKFNEPPADGGYDPFMIQQLRAIAAAARVMYEQVSGDYSKINDRTYRAAVNEFRRRVAMLQHHLVAFRLCRPVMDTWLDLALLGGAISLPSGMLRSDVKVKWVPQGWSYIHPVQEVQANREAVRAGFKSRAQVVSEQGDDVETVELEIAADNTRAEDLGLVFDSDAANEAAAADAGGDGPESDPRFAAWVAQLAQQPPQKLVLNVDAKRPLQRWSVKRQADGSTVMEEIAPNG